MGDDQQGRGALQHALHRLVQGLRVEGGKALVEDETVGALQQGGAELAFEIPTITREMVVVIQGLIILFSGALVNMPRPWLQRLLALRS